MPGDDTHEPSLPRPRPQPGERLTVWSWRILICDAIVLLATVMMLGGVSRSGGDDGTLAFFAPFLFVGVPLVVVGSIAGMTLTTIGRMRHGSSPAHIRCLISHVAVLGVLVAVLAGVLT